MQSIDGNGRQSDGLSELKNIAAGREVFYNFLSRTYEREIDKSYLDMLVDLTPYIEGITTDSGEENLIQGGKIIVGFTAALDTVQDSGEEELILELARNFASLFLIGKGAIPTSSSFYLSPDHLRKQDPYFQVLEVYQEIGFEKPERFNEDEDHIAVELLFMAVLSNLISQTIGSGEIDKVSRYLKIQQSFLEINMLSWIPIFCERLIEIAGNREFYKSVAMLTAGFLTTDAEYLKNADTLFSGE